jgi:hypothetical protein
MRNAGGCPASWSSSSRNEPQLIAFNEYVNDGQHNLVIEFGHQIAADTARALARRSLAVALACVAWLALAATPASAACGQTIQVNARRALGPGSPPLAVGDSVLYDAAPLLANYGFTSNAMVCRTMAQGISYLEQQHDLPVLVVVALGTNGSVTTEQIDQLLNIVGPDRLLAMVTPHHGDYSYVPELIRNAAQQHSQRMVVLDWDRVSANHPGWFAPDGIHLGGSAGIAAYAQLIATALLATPARLPSPTVKRIPPRRSPAKVEPRASKAKPKASRRSRPAASDPLQGIEALGWPVIRTAVLAGMFLASP